MDQFARPASRFWKAMALLGPTAIMLLFGIDRVFGPHLPPLTVIVLGILESIVMLAISATVAKLYQNNIGSVAEEALRRVGESIYSREITKLSDAKEAYTRLTGIAPIERQARRRAVLES